MADANELTSFSAAVSGLESIDRTTDGLAGADQIVSSKSFPFLMIGWEMK